jgi:cell division septal protein FtsQ
MKPIPRRTVVRNRRDILRNREILRRRRRRAAIRIFIIAVLLTVMAVAYFYTAYSQKLQIKQITVIGNEEIPAEQIQQTLSKELDDSSRGFWNVFFPAKNILFIRTSHLESVLYEAYPKIAEVSVERTFKGRLQAAVLEKKPAFVVCILADKQKCAIADQYTDVYEMYLNRQLSYAHQQGSTFSKSSSDVENQASGTIDVTKVDGIKSSSTADVYNSKDIPSSTSSSSQSTYSQVGQQSTKEDFAKLDTYLSLPIIYITKDELRYGAALTKTEYELLNNIQNLLKSHQEYQMKDFTFSDEYSFSITLSNDIMIIIPRNSEAMTAFSYAYSVLSDSKTKQGKILVIDARYANKVFVKKAQDTSSTTTASTTLNLQTSPASIKNSR